MERETRLLWCLLPGDWILWSWSASEMMERQIKWCGLTAMCVQLARTPTCMRVCVYACANVCLCICGHVIFFLPSQSWVCWFTVAIKTTDDKPLWKSKCHFGPALICPSAWLGNTALGSWIQDTFRCSPCFKQKCCGKCLSPARVLSYRFTNSWALRISLLSELQHLWGRKKSLLEYNSCQIDSLEEQCASGIMYSREKWSKIIWSRKSRIG